MKDDRIQLADVVRRFKDDYVALFGHRMMSSARPPAGDRRRRLRRRAIVV
jgi:hypothetical protein